jgi:uncharacterized membrane protein
MNVRFDSRDLALTTVLSALYAVLVIVQGISAAATVQLRIADCLIPLTALLGWPAIIGMTLGAFVGNTYTSAALSNGVYDVAFGPLANLIAGLVIYMLRKRRLVGCMAGSVAIGVLVGSYVWMIFGGPSDIFSLKTPVSWPVWAASIVSITASSLIAIAGIGYLLLTLLGRPEILKPLRSRGLKTAAEE